MKRSPVFSLDEDIVRAPFNAAPEKAQQLHGKVSHLQIVFLDKAGEFIFCVGNGKIQISAGALNLLWAASYTYWVLYQGYVAAQRAGMGEYQTAKDGDAWNALRLYKWALKSTVAKRLEDWPSDLPRPVRSPVHESLIHAGTELFLVAVAWILLHEVGHVEGGHPSGAIAATAKSEEHEADAFATDWLLDGITDEGFLLKRALGIAVGNLVLFTLGLNQGSFQSTTHPPAYERLHRNLRFRQLAAEHPVHAFAVALIQIHLGLFGIDHTLPGNGSFDDLVDELCVRMSKAKLQRPK